MHRQRRDITLSPDIMGNYQTPKSHDNGRVRVTEAGRTCADCADTKCFKTSKRHDCKTDPCGLFTPKPHPQGARLTPDKLIERVCELERELVKAKDTAQTVCIRYPYCNFREQGVSKT
jgi:hypothetical protein